MIKKYLTILIFLIIAIGTISAVSAGDIAETTDVLSDNGDINEEVSSSEEIIAEETSANEDISSNEEIVTQEASANEDISSNEEIINDEISTNTLANEETDEDTISINENNKNILNANANDEEQALGSQTTDNTILNAQNSEEEILSSSDDLSTFKITLLGQSGSYASNKKVKFKVIEEDTGKPVANAEVVFYLYKSNGDWELWEYQTVNSNGIGYLTFNTLERAGTYKLVVSISDWNDKYGEEVYCDDITYRNFRINKQPLKISPIRLNTYYNSNKAFQIRVLDSNNRPMSNVQLKVRIYTNGRYRTYSLLTNSRGIAQYKYASKLSVGTHRVVVTVNDPLYTGRTAASYIKVLDNVQIVSRSQRAVVYDDQSGKNVIIGGVIDIRVKDKKTKKFTNGIPVTLKIRNGNGYKTLRLVTGSDGSSNGWVGYATNMLKAGTHNAKIIVNTGKYKGTANARIVIPKSSKYLPNWYILLSRGKIKQYWARY